MTIIYGFAATGAKDAHGQRIGKGAMADALPAFLRFPALREMHGPIAAGKIVDTALDRRGRLFVVAEVVDRQAVEKVQSGVLRGLSIGGKRIKKADGVISRLRLSEISLVDRPANPECSFEVWYGNGIPSAAELLSKHEAAERKAAIVKNCRRAHRDEMRIYHQLKKE